MWPALVQSCIEDKERNSAQWQCEESASFDFYAFTLRRIIEQLTYASPYNRAFEL